MGNENTKGNQLLTPAGISSMDEALQKKFSKGIQYNMKIVIRGERNTGKTNLFRRMEGKQFNEAYTPTTAINVTSILWSYKVTSDTVKVEVWDVVDKGKPQKKGNMPLKLANEAEEPSGDARSVLHFHYTNWHDYGTPTHLAPLINFIRVVNQSHVEHGPLLVHCSAGVGRTGTVIAIDYCMKQVQKEGEVDVKGVVSLLREQRNFMVQTEQQFMCIHYVLLEAILCGDTSYMISAFSAEYHSLQMKNAKTGMSLVEEEFKKLNSVKTMISKSSFISKVKAGETPDQEYPAYFVKGYLNTQQFIVADGPSVDNTERFWQMLVDNGCSNVVTLTPKDAGVDPYWPPCHHKMSLSNISVEVLEEQPEHMYNVRKILLTNRSGNTHLIIQYEYIGWTIDTMPDVMGFVQFVYDVAKRIDEASYTNNTILVHDTTSLGPSGVFCALWHCVERLRLEKVVDVFQAVQKLQLQKPGMVESVKQYAFIYDCVHEFIEITTTTTV